MDNQGELKKLIEKYVTGGLSDEERTLLYQWYQSFGEEKKGIPILDDVEARQRMEEALVSHVKQVMFSSKSTPVKIRKWKKWLPLVAAAMILIVLGALLWKSNMETLYGREPRIAAVSSTFREIKTGVRELKQLALPDGSTAIVNANSVVRIPEKFNGQSRKILLDEGEAYFEVAKGTKPFVVQTAVGLRVEVVGTGFNVQAYQAMEDIVVAVKHGKVRVSDKEGILDELTKQQGVRYRKADRKTWKTTPIAGEIDDWANGMIHLEEASFAELATGMYNLYGVKLEAAYPTIHDNRYNIVLRSSRTLEETLKMICGINKTSYKRNGQLVTIYP